MIVQPSDNRGERGYFQRRVVDVDSRDIDRLEELGHETETVSGSVEKLLVPTNLIHHMYQYWAIL